ncbi:MAG: helix-turn-helix domain containing protein [Holophaga sp.]|nr:helix-turn-helix domain containing protein [Holophaga sp.]
MSVHKHGILSYRLSMKSPGRSDAIKRRELLLDAAVEVFALQGLSAPLDAIATRAGVGQGTLYRNFADRDELVLALVKRDLDRLEASLRDVPLAGHLVAMIQAMAEQSVLNSAMCEYWTALSPDSVHLLEGLAHFHSLAGKGLPAAIAAGQLRPDLTPEDIGLVGIMFRAIRLGTSEAERRRVKGRVLDLLMRGLVP